MTNYITTLQSVSLSLASKNSQSPYHESLIIDDWYSSDIEQILNILQFTSQVTKPFKAKVLPVILLEGSNVSILSTRSMAKGWTCG